MSRVINFQLANYYGIRNFEAGQNNGSSIKTPQWNRNISTTTTDIQPQTWCNVFIWCKVSAVRGRNLYVTYSEIASNWALLWVFLLECTWYSGVSMIIFYSQIWTCQTSFVYFIFIYYFSRQTMATMFFFILEKADFLFWEKTFFFFGK